MHDRLQPFRSLRCGFDRSGGRVEFARGEHHAPGGGNADGRRTAHDQGMDRDCDRAGRAACIDYGRRMRLDLTDLGGRRQGRVRFFVSAGRTAGPVADTPFVKRGSGFD